LTEIAKLRTGFFAGILLLLAIAAAIFVRTNAVESASREIAHTHDVLRELHEVALNSSEAENAFRKLGAGAEEGRQALDRTTQHEAELEKLVADNAVQQNNLVFARVLLRRHSDALRLGSEGLAELDQTSDSRDLLATIARMTDEEHYLLARRTQREANMVRYSRFVIFAATTLAFALIVIGALRMNRDFVKRNAAEKKLAARDEQYRQVVDQAGDIIYRTDPEGRFTFCNQSALQMLHYQESEVLGRSYLKLIRQDKRREAERFYLRQFGRRQKSTYYEFPLVDGHGRERWVGQNVQLVLEGDKPVGFQAIARGTSSAIFSATAKSRAFWGINRKIIRASVMC
jgi:PAS domain S-box-containing protein